jgi:hypothetical protein
MFMLTIGRKGPPCSAETRIKIGLANGGENHPMYGKSPSTNHRKNLSIAHKGKLWWNNGSIEKMSRLPPSDLFVRGRLPKLL